MQRVHLFSCWSAEKCGFSRPTGALKPQLHCHDFGHDGATTHPDLSSRDASA